MHRPRNAIALDRRRLLTGAVASASAFPWSSARAQEAAPTPVPIRIQTPDLAFVDAIQAQMDIFQSSHSANNLLLSIVSAEPASDSLLNDLRLGGRRFSGAFVPYWLIPDLVRDGFIAPAKPPPVLLPPSLAVLRSFGGAWVATDFDHDCDLLYTRLDLIGQSGSAPPETWDELLAVLAETNARIALPRRHAEQVGEHFASMAASYVGAGPFWFQPESMDPLISSEAHQKALSDWKLLGEHAIEPSSTGELWRSFFSGEAAFLIASADALPHFVTASLDPTVIGISPLPGVRMEDGAVQRAGNTTGANWGGVTIAGLDGTGAVADFFEFIAGPEAQAALWTDPTTGIDPAAHQVNVDLAVAEDAGWPRQPTESWLRAIDETLNNPLQLTPLRIAETQRYSSAWEQRIVSFLSGEVTTAREALKLAAEDWRSINQAIDVDVQRDLFARSLAPPPLE